MTTKTQEKVKPLLKPEFVKGAKKMAIEGGKVILQGALFSFGGFCTNKIIRVTSSRNVKAMVRGSSNVLELKSKPA